MLNKLIERFTFFSYAFLYKQTTTSLFCYTQKKKKKEKVAIKDKEYLLISSMKLSIKLPFMKKNAEWLAKIKQ